MQLLCPVPKQCQAGAGGNNLSQDTVGTLLEEFTMACHTKGGLRKHWELLQKAVGC